MGLPSTRQGQRLGGPTGEVTGSHDPRALAKDVAEALMARFKKVAIAELFEGIAKGELKELSEGCSRDLGEACSPQSIDEINTLLTADGEEGEGLIARLRVRCAKVRRIALHMFYTASPLTRAFLAGYRLNRDQNGRRDVGGGDCKGHRPEAVGRKSVDEWDPHLPLP